MNIRIGFSVVFSILIAALIFCSVKSFRSQKSIGKAVGLLDIALIPPMIGNLIIIGSTVRESALVGYYIYFIGMNLVMMALMKFAAKYFYGTGNGQKVPTFMYILPVADTIQLLFNPVFGHAFNIETVEVQENPYYRLIPYFGQTLHRIVDYAVFCSVVLIFIIGTKKAARIYHERYSVILVSMVLVAIWETFYIFSRTPVDRSMIGFGVFGLLVFFFSLHYRPLRLLDRMLSDSDNSDKAQTIIRNIIKLSDELDIVSLTEGVETQHQYSQLSNVGCKLFQGYFFAKPMPKEEFEEFAFARTNAS